MRRNEIEMEVETRSYKPKYGELAEAVEAACHADPEAQVIDVVLTLLKKNRTWRVHDREVAKAYRNLKKAHKPTRMSSIRALFSRRVAESSSNQAEMLKKEEKAANSDAAKVSPDTFILNKTYSADSDIEDVGSVGSSVASIGSISAAGSVTYTMQDAIKHENCPLDGLSTMMEAMKFDGSVRFGNWFLPLPDQVHGKLLCEGSELQPCKKGETIKLFLDHRKGKRTTFIKTDEGDLYGGGISMHDFRRTGNKGGFVLKDQTGHSLALCQLEPSDRHSFDYVIYGRQPIDKEPSDSKWQFFPWFRISSFNMGPFENQAIFVFNGNKFEPVLKVKAVCAQVHKIIVSNLDKKNSLGYAEMQYMKKGKSSGWEINIAAGADPALILCVAMICCYP